MKRSAGSFRINGEIKAPPSKSLTQRALLAAALSSGFTSVKNPSSAEDPFSMIRALKNFNVETKFDKNSNGIIVDSENFQSPESVINCGESGFTLRTLSVISSLFENEKMLTGKGTLLNRRFNEIISELSKFNIDIISNHGCLPVKLKNKLIPGKYDIDASGTSQLLSGLLFTLPLINGDSVLNVSSLKSSPFIDMTLDVIEKSGVDIIRNGNVFHIRGNQKYNLKEITVEGDWGLSSFFIASAAKTGELRINNLNGNSPQGERIFFDLAKEAGASIHFDGNTVEIQGNENIKCIDFNAVDYPDLVPPLVVLALNCKGRSRIKGMHRLYNKESNRAETLTKSFEKIGAKIELRDDDMLIEGGRLKGGETTAFNDHRIAMALAAAGSNSESDIIIDDAKSVLKSYKRFFKDLEKLTS